MSKDTIKDLTLRLMYLTSWEESLVPGTRRKPDRASIYPKVRVCWKGCDFNILNGLTDEDWSTPEETASLHPSLMMARKSVGAVETVWDRLGTA